ncbi:MAG: nuclear transport factor 2 family protein [Caulobacterales bacterium]|uniref:nuclear transport factor 2 family protein n=1 Tax=Glycocaulis sp. TaxID=1969725 RepID=UPI003FA0007D
MLAAHAIANSATGPAMLAEAQLAAYNARDLDAFAACFSDDVEVYDFPGALSLKGREAFRVRYVERFKSEGLHAIAVHRAVIGARVIDHERVWLEGEAKSAPIDLVVIYTVRDGLIARVDFIREG